MTCAVGLSHHSTALRIQDNYRRTANVGELSVGSNIGSRPGLIPRYLAAFAHQPVR